LFEAYDDSTWAAIKGQTPFHKLSDKYEKEKEMIQNTYYSKIIRGSKVICRLNGAAPLRFSAVPSLKRVGCAA